MIHLIDKDTLVAEIKHHLKFTPEHTNAFIEGEEHAYNQILSFIDTFEVKEVDLDKETEIQERKDIENAFKAGYKVGYEDGSKTQKYE